MVNFLVLFFFVFLLLRFYTPLWYGLCTLLLWWKSTCVPETISVEIFCDGFTILQVLSSLIFTVPLIDPHLYTLFYNFIIYYSVFLLIFVSEIYTTGFCGKGISRWRYKSWSVNPLRINNSDVSTWIPTGSDRFQLSLNLKTHLSYS